uniref:BTB domain-containing protein n=1 Tax=Panagrolaimus sp. ES5 TaxID=591445 RepID=A0AC34G0V1_9BILA
MASRKIKLRESKKITCPFAINWVIPRSTLEEMTQHDEFLVTPIYDASNIPGIGYQILLHPSRLLCNNIKAVSFFFLVAVGDEKEVYGSYTVEIKSADFRQHHRFNYLSTDTAAFSKFIGPRNDILNPENGYLKDDKLILQFSGTINVFRPNLMLQNDCSFKRQKFQSLGDSFWLNNDKDFSIVAGTKKILVHKAVLSVVSEVFNRMLQSNCIETNENKIEIPDFDFLTVETAIKLCYDQNIDDIFNVQIGADLIRFFDKYLMNGLKNSIEARLIPEITVLNACKLATIAVFFNASKLEKECVNFLHICLNENVMVSDIDELHESLSVNGLNFSSFSYQS